MIVTVYFLVLTLMPPPLYNEHVAAAEGNSVNVTGRVDRLRFKNEKVQIYLRDVSVQTHTSSTSFKTTEYFKIRGLILYPEDDTDSAALRQTVLPGYTVRAAGSIHTFDRATNPGQFDTAAYYARMGIEGMVSRARIISVKRGGSFISSFPALMRYKLESSLSGYLDESDAGMLYAMLLGEKDGIAREDREAYEKSGLSHLLAVSGTHVAIIGMAVLGLLKGAGRKRAALGALLAVVAFGMLTGMGTSTRRAVIMFSICMMARLFGRAYDLATALMLSAVIILVGNPLMVKDAGFLLSFVAVGGIALVLPVLRGMCSCKNRVFRAVAGSLAVSLAVSIFTLPIVLHFYYRYPVYSCLLNLLLLPLFGVLLVCGLLLAFFSSLVPAAPVCCCLACICSLILQLYKSLCLASLDLPGALHITGKPGIVETVIYYAVIALSVILFYRKKSFKTGAGAALMMAAFVFLCMDRKKPGLNLVMLDVGQGDGILVYDRNFCALVDGGSSDVRNVGSGVLIPALKALGISRIDLIFVSHTDADHINGISELLTEARGEGIALGRLVMSTNSMESDAGRSLAGEAQKNRVVPLETGAGDVFTMGDMRYEVLYPDRGELGEANELSVVMRFSYGGFSALFTGDTEGEGEKHAAGRLKKERYTLYKTAHHGSRGSSGKELLEKIRPCVSIISCGRDNSYGHPHKETLERLEGTGSRIYVTAQCGAISAGYAGGRLGVKCYIGQDWR